jgi:branched-chain amino acid transport system permease protein
VAEDNETRRERIEEAVPSASATAGPRIGQDEWVARSAERRGGRGGRLGVIEARLRAVPWWAWLIFFVAVVAALPVGFESGYVRRVAFDTVIFMLLALGLNVVVGWGGLLDLGFIAFYGVGAYTYAILSADRYDLHLPVFVSIPAAAVVGGIVGLLVGLPSRRLVGDYLAIVTLFFFQIFLTVSNNSENIFGDNLAGGPNGILNVQPLSLFGRELPVSSEGIFNVAYLYVALAFFVVVFVALRFVNASRTGRAWRSLREDALAAELMGMPVNWLKLTAFAFGAGVAALTGTLVTALNGSVFPQTFEFPLLITVYTMVILGGAGSQAGVVIGAIGISVLLEVLREPGDSRFLFYALVLAGLIGTLRLSRRFAIVVGGTLLLGFALHALAGAVDGGWTAGAASGGGRLGEWANNWVVVPADLASWITPVSYIGLVAAVLTLTVVRGRLRLALLVPTLYLAAFVWENVMLARPEPTRFVVLGAILIAVMIARPEGVLGEKRVEIV